MHLVSVDTTHQLYSENMKNRKEWYFISLPIILIISIEHSLIFNLPGLNVSVWL